MRIIIVELGRREMLLRWCSGWVRVGRASIRECSQPAFEGVEVKQVPEDAGIELVVPFSPEQLIDVSVEQ
jgi:hypothetical protein